jgi:hypothetical protein
MTVSSFIIQGLVFSNHVINTKCMSIITLPILMDSPDKSILSVVACD